MGKAFEQAEVAALAGLPPEFLAALEAGDLELAERIALAASDGPVK